MSPLWRDEVGVFLGPRRVLLTRFKRGIAPRAVAELGFEVAGGPRGDWQPALAALDELLSGDAAWRDANVRIVLSNHWVRYALVPWSPALTHDAERLDHARHVFQSLFGDAALEWAVTLSAIAPGAHPIGAALDSALQSALAGVVERARLRLISLQPHLVTAYNCWRPALPADDAWFVCVEEEALAAVHLRGGAWQRVYNMRSGPDWPTELKRLRRLGALTSIEPDADAIYVDAPIGLRRGANGLDLRWLEEGAARETLSGKLVSLRRQFA